jgi:Leucine-rich repeat (LRR) protein
MIFLSCPACRKNVAVGEDQRGKQCNCPDCGNVLPIPVQINVPNPTEEMRPLPSPGPEPDRAGQWTHPSDPQAGDAVTHPPSRNPDATLGAGQPDASLTSFLAPPQADDELGRLGKYRILTILGHGGMGVVFKAEDPRLKRSVAIKAMLPTLAASASAGQRFLREAQAMAAVEHDHIVRIYQVDEERGVPFLAMEYLKGEPLAERLKQDGKLPLPDVLRIGREIAEALGAAHATGLIHRDIKPANIWLEAPRGRVKLLDFGLARAASQDAGLTQPGAIVGTPAYMAPEQARGEAVDARCDLFSLGVVLYRLSTGQQPFRGKDAVSTLMAVALDQPLPPARSNPEIPQELSDLVMRLLEKDADRRPASASEVAEVLQALERKLSRQGESRERPGAWTAVPVKGVAAPRRRRLPLFVAALVLLGGLIGVGAWTLIRIQGDQGNYVIDTDDPDFSFRVSKGAVTLEDRKTNRKYNLKVVRQEKATGEHELEVTDADAGLSFKTKTFTIKRGEQVALKAWFERKQEAGATVTPAPVDDAWLTQVTALPAAKQVEAVVAKLKDLNPSFDGKVTPKVEDGVVTELEFLTDNVTDISPVRALTGLRTLKCNGNGIFAGAHIDKGQLADLTPLKDMKVTYLDCGHTQVADLLPLKDMKVTYLDCTNTPVSDLTPLKDMMLTDLSCGGTKVSDLTPLKDMMLTSLNCGGTKVTDLSPLKGMKLTSLQVWGTPVSDLTPLKDMKLTTLYCNSTPVSDLSPLKDMKLTSLYCSGAPVPDLTPLKDMKLTTLMCDGTKVTDLSPLKGMPLTDLRCDFKPERDAEILRSLKTLETINYKPAKEFWKEVEAKQAAFQMWLKQVAAMPPAKQVEAVTAKLKELNPGFDGKVTHKIEDGVVTELEFKTHKVTDISPVRALMGLRMLDCGGTSADKGQLSDLSPLKDMKLTFLNCSETQVSDLTPLKDLQLTELLCNGTRVSDLTPLKQLKLTRLTFKGTQVSDLSPLEGMMLTDLGCGGTPVSDLSPLKDMKLTRLECWGTKVVDLSPLKDMNLTILYCNSTPVADLTPLKDMKLTLKALYCSSTPVADLSPLKGMKLTDLYCDGTEVADLSPLKGMPLKHLRCDFKPERDADILRSLNTLETINDKPAKEFWKEAEAKEREKP